MANLDAPIGFTLLENERYTIVRYQVDGSDATTIAKGDALDQDADGYVGRAAADAGVTVVGVCVATYDTDKKPLAYIPASTAGYVDVALALPGTRFMIQGDGDSASAAFADIGATANHVDGSANTFSGRSIQELDSDDIGAGLQLRIIGKANTLDNAWGANVNLIVTFNESLFAGDQATV